MNKRVFPILVAFAGVVLFALGVNLGLVLTSIDSTRLTAMRRRVQELKLANAQLENRVRSLRTEVDHSERRLRFANERLGMYRSSE